MKTENLDYTAGSNTFESYVAYDEAKSGKRPCVIICHAWAGQGESDQEVAGNLAKLGYVGFCADVYGKGLRGDPTGDNTHLMKPLLDDRAELKSRLLASVEAAKKHPMVDPSKIAAIGYCFGGLCVLDLARCGADVKGVVSFHGLFFPPNLGPQKEIKAKVLILHGWDDPMATPDQVVEVARELSEAKADWQIHGYGGTMHAFTAPQANQPDKGILYNETAAKRSWKAMENFLEEVLA
ncbi:MAG TPA: carboxymethylenebutenolidase [Candidatus Melainabacteria bacterium]|nr:carboxymethylenebutenolidase [Candidatus Melainabacteria bacterium]HIN65321.1 carboxymethylenebutenolidase [Candidatus Obscuribacterales bacterium]